MIRIDILTLFPKMFRGVFGESMLKIAQKKKKVNIKVHDLRKWTGDRHKTADDKPYGGGSGMVMKVEPIYKALKSLLGQNRVEKLKEGKGISKNIRIVLLTPQGKTFKQKVAQELAKSERIIFICGHYEGIDRRVSQLVSDEISIGDYILTGGEVPSLVILDAITRLMPGVLGDDSSLKRESFDGNLLEYPQYTRPREFQGMKVPDILLSGDHARIARWRKKEALKRTKDIRGDLLWKK